MWEIQLSTACELTNHDDDDDDKVVCKQCMLIADNK